MVDRRCVAGLLLVLAAAQAAWAAQVSDDLMDPRVRRISHELRCLVCQNQTLADSHAQLAVDLRNRIREQVEAGASDQQVVDHMVARYGDFVRYRPPLKPATWPLWFGPLALLVGGGVFALRRARPGARRVVKPS